MNWIKIYYIKINLKINCYHITSGSIEFWTKNSYLNVFFILNLLLVEKNCCINLKLTWTKLKEDKIKWSGRTLWSKSIKRNLKCKIL